MPSSKPTTTSVGNISITEMPKNDLRPAGEPQEGEGTRIGGQNIVTIDVDRENVIEDYNPGALSNTKGIHYSDVIRDSKESASRKSARFRLNELTRGPLSVEEEEEERIQSEIEKRLEVRFNEMREQVNKEAYEEGFAAGKNDAKTQVLAEAKPLIEGFDKFVHELENARHEIYKANEEFLINLVCKLAKAVILRELKEDVDYTKRLIVGLLDRVGTRENIKIFVGNEVYSSADKLKEGLAQNLGQLKNISIELDPEIENRGCRVETEFGEIDARISVQLQSIAQTMGVAF
ncbi:MAG: FliH/SctL family protein [Bdellovibrionota bacterium]